MLISIVYPYSKKHQSVPKNSTSPTGLGGQRRHLHGLSLFMAVFLLSGYKNVQAQMMTHQISCTENIPGSEYNQVVLDTGGIEGAAVRIRHDQQKKTRFGDIMKAANITEIVLYSQEAEFISPVEADRPNVIIKPAADEAASDSFSMLSEPKCSTFHWLEKALNVINLYTPAPAFRETEIDSTDDILFEQITGPINSYLMNDTNEIEELSVLSVVYSQSVKPTPVSTQSSDSNSAPKTSDMAIKTIVEITVTPTQSLLLYPEPSPSETQTVTPYASGSRIRQAPGTTSTQSNKPSVVVNKDGTSFTPVYGGKLDTASPTDRTYQICSNPTVSPSPSPTVSPSPSPSVTNLSGMLRWLNLKKK